jgi:gliding motility-associated lipoprotein GldH
MRISNRIWIIAATLLLVSCDKQCVFDEYKDVGTAWHQDSLVSFELPVLEANKKYNMFLTLRDNNDYPFNNIFLIVRLEQPNKVTLVDTLEYAMANPDGSLLGDGFTDVKESKLAYKQNLTAQKGAYKVSIQQAVRQTGKIPGVTELPGITDVGFRIEKTK